MVKNGRFGPKVGVNASPTHSRGPIDIFDAVDVFTHHADLLDDGALDGEVEGGEKVTWAWWGDADDFVKEGEVVGEVPIVLACGQDATADNGVTCLMSSDVGG